jgi:hypothetical protein
MTDSQLQDAELREMVMGVALALCASVVEKAEAAGLQQAHLVEDVPAGGVTWAMRAIFYGEPQTVGLNAVVKSPPEEASEGAEVADGAMFFSHEALLRVFGLGPQAPQLQFVAPVSWIKLAHAKASSG